MAGGVNRAGVFAEYHREALKPEGANVVSERSQKNASEASPLPEWEQALDRLEQSLREAAADIVLLRRSLQSSAKEARQAGPELVSGPEPGPEPAPEPVPESAPNAAESWEAAPESASPTAEPTPIASEQAKPKRESQRLSAFDRLWDRVEQEKLEKAENESGKKQEADEPERRGLEALPQQYLMTVEDRESKVDLVPLHRSLAGLPGMEEVSLVSYANGVAVVSMRVEGELSLEKLGEVVATAMDRECEVIPQDKTKIYLRLRAGER